MPTPHVLDLFLDESGTFTETEADTDAPGAFASQLVGLVTDEGAITPKEARACLELAHRAAGWQYNGQFHGVQRRPGAAYDALVVAMVEQLRKRG